jgi:hypothetical protein
MKREKGVRGRERGRGGEREGGREEEQKRQGGLGESERIERKWMTREV